MEIEVRLAMRGEVLARQKDRFSLIAQQCDFSFLAWQRCTRINDLASNVHRVSGTDSYQFLPTLLPAKAQA